MPRNLPLALALIPAASCNIASLLADGQAVPFTFANNTATIPLPAARRSKLPDIIRIQLP